jgi:carbon monoxide dehydrogenase subunit G
LQIDVDDPRNRNLHATRLVDPCLKPPEPRISMRLDISKSATLATSADSVWALLRQPARVAACLPNVEEFSGRATPDEYLAVLAERLGPFAIHIPLRVSVVEDAVAQRITAAVSGEDRAGNARVRGEIGAAVTTVGAGATIDVTSKVEVIGRLATLGAVPIRRRGDQVFDQFIENLRVAVAAGSADVL